MNNLSPGAIIIFKKTISNNHHLPTIDDDVILDEFWKGLEKWSETTTSTSPFTRHLGRYTKNCIHRMEMILKYKKNNRNPSIEFMQVYFYIAMAALGSVILSTIGAMQRH